MSTALLWSGFMTYGYWTFRKTLVAFVPPGGTNIWSSSWTIRLPLSTPGLAVCSMMLTVDWVSMKPVTCYAVVTCEMKLLWNNFEIISVFHFTCNHQLLTFGHSGAQSWAPECPNVRNWCYTWNKTLKYHLISHVTTSETEIKLFQLLKEFWNYFVYIEHVEKYSRELQ